MLVVIAPASRAQDASLVPHPVALTTVSAPAPAAVVRQADSTNTAVGPTRTAAAVGVRTAPEPLAVPAPAHGQGFSQSQAFMIVGGAAVLTGIVVGGNAGYAISIGGAVVGLYGLYQYLQ